MSERKTCFIVTADDFGRSSSINQAVEKAAREGILTCASLMVTGDAAQEAVEMARSLPSLQIGLHLALTDVKPASPSEEVPDLVTAEGSLEKSPAKVGISLQFKRKVAIQVEKEVVSQLEAFSRTGLALSHVDCHHHLHVHPRLFDMILKHAPHYSLRTIRIPDEPWNLSGPISGGHPVRNWFYRQVFGGLGKMCRKKASLAGIACADGVFGLYRTGEISESWLLQLLEVMEKAPGIYEFYTHPDLQGEGKSEFSCLMSGQIRQKLNEKGISTIRYRDIVERK